MATSRLFVSFPSKVSFSTVCHTGVMTLLALLTALFIYEEHMYTFARDSRISTRERMLEITADAHQDLVYLPTPDILMVTMAKGGSTSVWNWLYTGVTGRPKFDMKECETYVHDVRSHCWGKEAVHLYQLPEDEQWRILNNRKTLRVAVQRNPFERLVSSWKSKFACDAEKYGTDLRNREKMVPALLRQAEMDTNGKECLSIEEFAIALEKVQKRVKNGESEWLNSLRKLDVHLRPQNFYFQEIAWDIVLDVTDLERVARLRPIIERLPFRELVKDGPPRKHVSGGGEIMISESTARRLYSFALESKTGSQKYIE